MTALVATPLAICPTLADLAGVPASSGGYLPGSLAYVATVGAYFAYQPTSALAPDGITIVAAGGGGNWLRAATGIAEAAITQTAWFVDAQNSTGTASNENSGLTSGTALRSKAEIMRRMGTWRPAFNALQVVITYLSPDTTGNDPGLFEPYFLGGATLTHTAPLPATSFTGSLLAVTAKNAAGNQALRSTFTVTTGAVAINMLLVNTTRGNSRAIAQRNTGAGLWQISQPLTPYGGTGFPPGTEVNTWANGDAILGYVLPNVDLASLSGQSVEVPAAYNAPSHIAWQVTIWDPNPNAVEADPVLASGTCVFLLVEVVVLRSLTVNGMTSPYKGQIVNCSLYIETLISNSGIAVGPIVRGGIVAGIAFLASVQIDFDTIVAPLAVVFVDALINGSICVDSGTLTCNGTTQVSLAAVLYGAGAFQVQQGVIRYFSSAVSSFPLTGGLQINAATKAYSNATVAGLTTTHLLTLTPAALDAAAGAAGFGGLAYIPGVGGFQSGTLTP